MIKQGRTLKGVTLIELLVAASMATFIGFGIYKIFASGITVWRWIEANRPSADAMIFFEKIAGDLRNHCRFFEQSFEGNADTITFFVHDSDYLFLSENELIASQKDQKEGIYKVEYTYVSSEKAIKRQRYKLGEKHPFVSSRVLTGIARAQFTFHLYQPSLGDLSETHVASDTVPHAVGIWIEFQGDNGAMRQLHKVVYIPVGAKWN